MFIDHFALGFAAKRATPQVPLVVLFGVAQLADVLWPFFLAAGFEQVRVRADDHPLWLYMRATRARERMRPPPSITALYRSAIALFAIVLVWSWWAERA